MIIDAHTHWWPDTISGKSRKFIARWLRDLASVYGFSKGIHDTLDYIAPYFGESAAKVIIRDLDQSGVDAAVIALVDNPNHELSDGELMAAIEALGRMGLKHQGRIIPFAGINPGRRDAPEKLKQAIEQFGIRGLKWHSDVACFWPNGPEAYEMLSVLQESGLPLLAHTGNLPRPAKGKYAHPMLFDEILVDFPNLRIIAAHLGHRWWPDWAAIAEFKDNFYGDLAEWQLIQHANPEDFRRDLRRILDIGGADRVLFGTDAPGLEAFVSRKLFVERIQRLASSEDGGVAFTSEEVAGILGLNAARVLGLPEMSAK